MFYVLTHFTPEMLPISAVVQFEQVSQAKALSIFTEEVRMNEARGREPFISSIESSVTAKVISVILDCEMKPAVKDIKLSKGDSGLVFLVKARPGDIYLYDWLFIKELVDSGTIKIFHFKIL